MYYLLYKEMSFVATLASMSFFKRSGTYNLYSFGTVEYKNDVKTEKKNMETHVFMQEPDCVIIYLYKNKLCVALSSICDSSFFFFFFFHINKQKCSFFFFFFFILTSKNAFIICLGEIRFLGYKVSKLIFFSGLCLNFMLYK